MKRDLAPALALALLLSNWPAARASAAPLTRQTPARQTAPAAQRPTPSPTPTPPPEEDEVVRITANLVQFDAVVTDRNGRPVTDLKPEEFEVFLGGKPQEIANFGFVSSEPAAATEPAAASPSTRRDRDAPPAPPRPLRASQVRRTIALVVDDLGTSFTDLHYVRRALRKYVDEQMQPGDLVAIIQTGKGLGALQQFTADRRLLHRAIEGIRWNPTGGAGLSAFAPVESDPLAQAGGAAGGGPASGGGQPERDAGAALEEFREGVFTVGTLGALNFIVRGMKELPGRKSVILFSGGFRIFKDIKNPDDALDSERVLESLRRLTDQANRASVVIYTMDARGLAVTSLTAADNVGNARQAMQALGERADQLRQNREGLSYIAEQTGGIFIRDTNDLGGGVRRVLEDQKGYYLIGFRPAAEVFEPDGTRTRFNKFEVRVRRAGLRVRTRAGFYGYAEGQARPAAARTRAEQMMAAITSPLAAGGVGLRLTSLFNSPADGATFLDSLLHVDVSGFTLADEPDGWKRLVFDVVALTFGESGQVVDQINRTETVRARADALEAILADGLVYVMKVPVAKPGAYQLRVAVRDAASERVGSASQFVEVPDLGKRRLALSGIFITGAADDAVARPASPAPAQSAGAEQAGGRDPLRDATVRRFRQGEQVDFRYHIYNAKVDRSTGRTRLLTQTRLFRDGRPVYTSAAQPYDPGPPQNPAPRFEAGRRLLLGTQLPPGEYVLQVVVTDELAKGKDRTATQWIDFELLK